MSLPFPFTPTLAPSSFLTASLSPPPPPPPSFQGWPAASKAGMTFAPQWSPFIADARAGSSLASIIAHQPGVMFPPDVTGSYYVDIEVTDGCRAPVVQLTLVEPWSAACTASASLSQLALVFALAQLAVWAVAYYRYGAALVPFHPESPGALSEDARRVRAWESMLKRSAERRLKKIRARRLAQIKADRAKAKIAWAAARRERRAARRRLGATDAKLDEEEAANGTGEFPGDREPLPEIQVELEDDSEIALKPMFIVRWETLRFAVVVLQATQLVSLAFSPNVWWPSGLTLGLPLLDLVLPPPGNAARLWALAAALVVAALWPPPPPMSGPLDHATMTDREREQLTPLKQVL